MHIYIYIQEIHDMKKIPQAQSIHHDTTLEIIYPKLEFCLNTSSSQCVLTFKGVYFVLS